MKHTEIKTFEDACKVRALNPTHLPDVSMLPEKHQKAIVAFYKLTIVAEALNADWTPNFSNWDERKYFPWLEVETTEDNTSGVGFSDSHYDFTYTHASVGSRLCFKSSELALYAAKQFEDLYKDYLLLPN